MVFDQNTLVVRKTRPAAGNMINNGGKNVVQLVTKFGVFIDHHNFAIGAKREDGKDSCEPNSADNC